MADCIIIGAGLIGMLTAHELVNAGLQVTVLDRQRPGRESSWAGGGILSPLYPWNYPNAVNELASWGQQRYADYCQQLMDASGIDPQWTQTGLLIADIESPDLLNSWQNRFNAKLERVSSNQIQAIEPGLGIDVADAVWLPQVAQVRNPRLVQALRTSLERAGVEFRSDCPAQAWVTNGDWVSAVKTPEGELSAGAYIVAGGAWSGELLSTTGLQLPIEPIRGQMLLFKGPPGLVRTITLYQSRYVIPRRDGHVLVGSTLEQVGFDKQTTAEARADLEASAYQLIPALARHTIEQHWSGLRPGSPAGIPAIGPHPELGNLFINTGHFRNGVVLGPASARLLADHVLVRIPEFAAESYLPENIVKTD
ncbi:Glycine oxidase ThiO [hydrothermal vent metagenome]|uniref:Glycine oxidase ThiO n=1 Tax=hydrothermal vent metagenome TaxID=652676 RepID=A0A3B0Z2Z2_9ZZZZ